MDARSASGMLGKLLACGALLFASSAYANGRFRQDGWDLFIRQDRFTGQVRCDLAASDRRIRYQPGAVGFLTSKDRDTETAWYQVDTAAPVRWQDRTAHLIAGGVEIAGPSIDNPTGGWVWVPAEEVAHARTVAIKPENHARVRHYRLGGFAAMLDAAHRLGCSSDDAFRI